MMGQLLDEDPGRTPTSKSHEPPESQAKAKECLTGLLPFDIPADARTAMHKMDAIADQAEFRDSGLGFDFRAGGSRTLLIPTNIMS